MSEKAKGIRTSDLVSAFENWMDLKIDIQVLKSVIKWEFEAKDFRHHLVNRHQKEKMNLKKDIWVLKGVN